MKTFRKEFWHFSALLITILSFLIIGCHKNDDINNNNFTAGKNRFTTTIDGTQREYFVHVPANYKGNAATPVVFMFHGTGQTGEQFYNISGWKEVGDSANILTVFPSALTYCVTEDGVTETTTKWNSLPGGSVFCPDVKLKDDIKFVKQIITELTVKYNVDTKRIYTVGFSNGGQFSATCAIQISDIIAAAISCGGGGSIPRDSTYTPVRLLPTMLMFGNKDGKLLKGAGLPSTASVPMGFDKLYAAYPYLYVVQPKPYIKTFKLNEANYKVTGDTNSVVIADYVGLSGNTNNVFKMMEVKGLEHEYPNGKNHPMNAATYHWAWLKQYLLP